MSDEVINVSGDSAGTSAPMAPVSAPAVPDTPAVESTSVVPAQTEGFSEVEKADAARTDELQKIWNKLNPTRDPDTKQFAPKNPEENKPGTEPEVTDGAQADQVAKEKQPSIDPPMSWTAEAKAKWDAVPPDLKPYLAQRDKAYHESYGKSQQKVKQYEAYHNQAYRPFDQIIESYKDTFNKRGIHPAQAFAVLMDAQKQLDSSPVDGLVKIAQSYGIDLRPAFQGYQVQAPQTQQQLEDHPTIVQQKQRIEQLENYINERAQKRQVRQDREILNHIGSFQSEKSKEGTPLRPYFEEAKPMMAVLLEKGQAKDLEQAYDMAVHATPTLRQRIQSDQRKAEEAKRTAEAKIKAGDARKSNSINVKSASVGGTAPKSMDDGLTEIAMKSWPGWRPSATG